MSNDFLHLSTFRTTCRLTGDRCINKAIVPILSIHILDIRIQRIESGSDLIDVDDKRPIGQSQAAKLACMESDQPRCVNDVLHAYYTHTKGSCVTRRAALFPTSVWEERRQRSRKEEDVLREAHGTERERERENNPLSSSARMPYNGRRLSYIREKHHESACYKAGDIEDGNREVQCGGKSWNIVICTGVTRFSRITKHHRTS